MAIINQMTEAATYAMKLDEEMLRLRNEMKQLEARYESVSQGDLELERCIAQMEKFFDKAEDLGEFERLVSDYLYDEYITDTIELAKSFVLSKLD